MHLHDSGHNHDSQRHHHAFDISLENRMASRVLLISFWLLLITALLQSVFVYFTGSAALLADSVHNYADAFTSLPLWIAFALSKRKSPRRFPYGMDRVEDLAGLFIILIIFGSGLLIIVETIGRLFRPVTLSHHGWGILAGIVGFAGNELAAIYKISTGKKIDSQALIADGQHARSDGLTSLAAVAGILGAWLGYSWVDTLFGLGIACFVLGIAVFSGKELLVHLLDGISPDLVEQIEHICRHHPKVRDVYDLRARWFGRKILAELTLALDPGIGLQQAHAIAEEVRHSLLHEIKRVADVTVHFDPAGVQAHQLTAHHFR